MASVKALVVAGGGGGGSSSSSNLGGGGGAGGFIYNTNFTVSYQTYSIVVGAGGAITTKGNDSIFSSITSEGGGSGGSTNKNGGSGGGGIRYFAGGTASAGNNGGSSYYPYGGGGGGGAGVQGSDGSKVAGSGNGGNGLPNPIVGSNAGENISGTYYLAGGGGGGEFDGNYVGLGGYGGGGKANLNAAGTAGSINTGGGGGGGSSNNNPYPLGAAGGSGIVIISWITADFGTCSVTGTGNAITTSGENSIATFITSGDLVLVEGIPPMALSNFGIYSKRASTVTKSLHNFNGNSNDTSGNNLNGTDTSMSYTTGKYNLCASFNGSNARIQLPDTAGINTTFTLNTFIKLNGTNAYNTIYSKGTDASNGWGCLYTISTTLFEAAVVTTTPTTAQQTLSQAISINTGEYYMLTLVFDNSARTLKGYINGNLIKSIATGANLRGTSSVYLGVNKGGASFSNYFNGSMDELVIENRAWTDDEIRKFYTYSRGNFGII